MFNKYKKKLHLYTRFIIITSLHRHIPLDDLLNWDFPTFLSEGHNLQHIYHGLKIHYIPLFFFILHGGCVQLKNIKRRTPSKYSLYQIDLWIKYMKLSSIFICENLYPLNKNDWRWVFIDTNKTSNFNLILVNMKIHSRCRPFIFKVSPKLYKNERDYYWNLIDLQLKYCCKDL